MSWFQTTGETRARVLKLLRRSQRTINDLAEELGVTDNAVRAHVAGLERDGLVVQSGVQRDTGGKPARVYDITPEGEDVFPKAYAAVLSEVLTTLEDREGREAVIQLLRDVGNRLAPTTDDCPPLLGERVEAAAEVLRSIGGDVDVLREPDGWKLQAHGCPLAAVIDDRPEACALAEELVSAVVGQSAQECCKHNGRPRCAFRISNAVD